jgi:hypothetical protein
MTTVIHPRFLRALALVTLATGLAVSLAACSGSQTAAVKHPKPTANAPASAPSTATATALGFAKKATALVKEQTPDAVLLGVQTPTQTMVLPPVKWDYLFGDPKRNKIVVVEMSADSTGSPTDAGNSNVKGKEYQRVEPISAMKVDSDKAYAAASAYYKKLYRTEPPGSASMGLVLVKPANTKAVGAKALQWEVYFFPASGDASKAVRISVDAVTGKAYVAAAAKA